MSNPTVVTQLFADLRARAGLYDSLRCQQRQAAEEAQKTERRIALLREILLLEGVGESDLPTFGSQ